jgi:hypothetical protein
LVQRQNVGLPATAHRWLQQWIVPQAIMTVAAFKAANTAHSSVAPLNPVWYGYPIRIARIV